MQGYLISTPPVGDPRTRNIEVFSETMKVAKAGVTPGHQPKNFSEAYQQMLEGSVMYNKPFSVVDIPSLNQPTEIVTEEEDCLS